ncbi:DoxX family protein [Porifericola rhodea]|uniref:DoxX family protein n=1 Tax=Porifericola rhodea TaxID=930972 RepID=UPI002666571C|nr:DoxX family protein [Porifericola rhodea]WKN33232.1 DoxX family protein [Porifericola rhodea]
MQVLNTTVARILFALPFIIFALFHFMNASAMAAMVPVPGGAFWVYFTGAAMLLAGVAILSGKYAYLACLLLALLLIIYVFAVHLSGAMAGNQQSITSLLKDTALAGGALALGYQFKK